MLKTTGCIVLVVCGTLMGLKFSERLKKRVKLLELTVRMINEIALQIRYSSPTVFELLDDLCNNPAYSELKYLIRIKEKRVCGKSFSEVWNDGLSDVKENDFTAEDYSVISEIGEELGRSDTDGQLTALALIKDKLLILRDNSAAEYEKKGKLYRTLGLLSGICVAILCV